MHNQVKECAGCSLPKDSERYRPRNTGWFADFEHLESAQTKVATVPISNVFGATFEPTPLYRANAVMDWMDAKNLSVENLRTQAKLQTELLISAFDDRHSTKKAFPSQALEIVSCVPTLCLSSTKMRLRSAQCSVKTDLGLMLEAHYCGLDLPHIRPLQSANKPSK